MNVREFLSRLLKRQAAPPPPAAVIPAAPAPPQDRLEMARAFRPGRPGKYIRWLKSNFLQVEDTENEK